MDEFMSFVKALLLALAAGAGIVVAFYLGFFLIILLVMIAVFIGYRIYSKWDEIEEWIDKQLDD